ncbi:carotenoid 1,2-hydratase [Vibrio sp. 404]|uniref:Carotenoid 1,2-hydratase n=1 Tax=Vibrio marinisediminis TaxID=2758441 RepID=A0A7W2FNW1_9VIBR|nr:lipocalin-like domain-containing protein [Vibrio marinisediminis]MBA5761561.1 carotenoid 1,2-hydratase [Vibrio marinisediminis]
MKRVIIAKLLTVASLVVVLIAAAILYKNYTQREATVNHHHGQKIDLLRNANTEQFESVTSETSVVIPQDFSLHKQYQHGWWHFFANVKDKQGKHYGIQWSYFRISNDDQDRLGWQNSQLYVSHIVVSSDTRVWKEQRLARGGIGQAGIENSPFKVWIDNWSWNSLGQTPFPGELLVATDKIQLNLSSVASGPFVLPGEKGYVARNENTALASHHLTAPFIDVSGELSIDGGDSLTIDGKAWMSKEWGSGLQTSGQKGWDWFVFHLDHETTLSIHRYRYQDAHKHIVATLSTSSGHVISLEEDEISVIPLQSTLLPGQKSVPLSWVINIPKYEISLTTQVLNANMWLPFILPYWEGPISTTGSHTGFGFMQLVGY